jgi:hypothetical protein
MAETFESREQNSCEWCIDLWGIHYCRIEGVPCVKLTECPEGRGKTNADE